MKKSREKLFIPEILIFSYQFLTKEYFSKLFKTFSILKSKKLIFFFYWKLLQQFSHFDSSPLTTYFFFPPSASIHETKSPSFLASHRVSSLCLWQPVNFLVLKELPDERLSERSTTTFRCYVKYARVLDFLSVRLSPVTWKVFMTPWGYFHRLQFIPLFERFNDKVRIHLPSFRWVSRIDAAYRFDAICHCDKVHILRSCLSSDSRHIRRTACASSASPGGK